MKPSEVVGWVSPDGRTEVASCSLEKLDTGARFIDTADDTNTEGRFRARYYWARTASLPDPQAPGWVLVTEAANVGGGYRRDVTEALARLLALEWLDRRFRVVAEGRG